MILIVIKIIKLVVYFFARAPICWFTPLRLVMSGARSKAGSPRAGGKNLATRALAGPSAVCRKLGVEPGARTGRSCPASSLTAGADGCPG